MFVKPWSKDAERVLKQLSYSGRAFVTENQRLPREFGVKCKEIINHDYLKVATTRNTKNRETWFITPPDVMVIPKPGNRGINFHFRKFRIL